MLEILVEIACSIFICGTAVYFFLLTVPAEERGVGKEGSGNCRRRHAGNVGPGAGCYGERSMPSLERSRKCEEAMWVNVLGRWVALLVLGGGSVDKDVWTDRIAYFIEEGAKRVGDAVGRKCAKDGGGERAMRLGPEPVRFVRVELGGGGCVSGSVGQQQQQQQQQQQPYSATSQGGAVGGTYHARTNSDVNRVSGGFAEAPDGGAVSNPLIGVVLPRVGPSGIISFEAPFNVATREVGAECVPSAVIRMKKTLRCFVVPITYEDQRFALQLACHLPLLFGLPAALSIPADVLTLRCALSVRRVIFHGVLYAAFLDNMVELSFASEPQFTALFDAASVNRHHHPLNRWQQQQQQQQSARNSVRCAVPGEMNAALPPLTSAVGGGAASLAHRSKEKLQEIVDLAVKRAVESITYPCVLQGHVGPPRKQTSPGATAEGNAPTNSLGDGLVTWTLQKATLPLCC
ncbi:hypothetical protein DQ04_01321120 [Trypanosoma grayi]|uniref:hypothetical protein n=1 Tax=Trypanosoma grayi TaxID=71804 RepID=UPI0004F41531|nr:hypothetical protein DQ04_01321120 [Trypanosoma grayi]KEG12939.1 hypothetical protein DQ04_01321120 [Trypanosoma grayi]